MPEQINEFNEGTEPTAGDVAVPDECDPPCPDPADVRLTRLSTRDVFTSFFDHILELDLPILKTVIGMTIRPGQVCREYVDGYRRRYTNPMKYAFLTATLLVVVYSLFDISPSRTVFGATGGPQSSGADMAQIDAANETPANDDQSDNVDGPDVDEQRTDEQEEADARARRIRAEAEKLPAETVAFVEGNLHFFSFFTLPLVAVVFLLLFRRAKLNYAEHYSFVLLVWGQAFLFQSVAALAGLHSTGWGFGAAVLGIFCYETWAVRMFYKQGLVISIAKMIVIILIDSIISTSLGIITAFAWVFYRFWQLGVFG